MRIATEGALLGSLIATGCRRSWWCSATGRGSSTSWCMPPAGFTRNGRWPGWCRTTSKHRAAIEQVPAADLGTVPGPEGVSAAARAARRPDLEARFDALCGQRTGYPSIDGVLKEMRAHRKRTCCGCWSGRRCRCTTTLSEADIRDYVKKRKISGSTRSEAGRRCRDTFASLKKTCRKLGVRFWDYLLDRVRGLGQVAWLPDLVRQRTRELAAGPSAAVLT